MFVYGKIKYFSNIKYIHAKSTHMQNHLKYSILLFIAAAFILWCQKPRIMFDGEGQMRPFGIGRAKTIFYFPFVILLFGMIVYFVCLNLSMRTRF